MAGAGELGRDHPAQRGEILVHEQAVVDEAGTVHHAGEWAERPRLFDRPLYVGGLPDVASEVADRGAALLQPG
ncbi:hypothetical protein Pflav_012910 [Phytohabitans flavus]|uniref:Uncharacterized protein n=1 Tax=Phytohabitans flavus TaxID=1076124 RepID=A0A6F8XM72_9ACTN|nr:hypothetical protein Pflav_012910 [Phytohabitans flavus]